MLITIALWEIKLLKDFLCCWCYKKRTEWDVLQVSFGKMKQKNVQLVLRTCMLHRRYMHIAGPSWDRSCR